MQKQCIFMYVQEPKLAFEGVDATELYPCVLFYSSNPGEKVSLLNLYTTFVYYIFYIVIILYIIIQLSKPSCSSTGLQVALCDLQMRGMPSDLLPGEPLCSPRATVLLESTIQLLRRLYVNDDWVQHINQHMLNKLQLINTLMREGQGKIGPLTCLLKPFIYLKIYILYIQYIYSLYICVASLQLIIWKCFRPCLLALLCNRNATIDNSQK